MRTVGILGYGNLGKFIADKILNDKQVGESLKLVFVWNRDQDKLKDLDASLQLLGPDLGAAYANFRHDNPAPDILVEFSHSSIVSEYGAMFLEESDVFISTVTAFADPTIENKLIEAAKDHSIYLPTGAAWGVQDILKMSKSDKIESLRVTMNFNADALRLVGPLADKLNSYINDSSAQDPLLLYKGDIRSIAPQAPNNVNTMCCLALAARNLGLDKTIGFLYAQKTTDAHIIDIELRGQDGFYVNTRRYNPAKKGAVTGNQTYHAFLSSLLEAHSKGAGIQFC